MGMGALGCNGGLAMLLLGQAMSNAMPYFWVRDTARGAAQHNTPEAPVQSKSRPGRPRKNLENWSGILHWSSSVPWCDMTISSTAAIVRLATSPRRLALSNLLNLTRVLREAQHDTDNHDK